MVQHRTNIIHFDNIKLTKKHIVVCTNQTRRVVFVAIKINLLKIIVFSFDILTYKNVFV